MWRIIFGALFLVLAWFTPTLIQVLMNKKEVGNWIKLLVRFLGLAVALLMLASTSFVTVPPDQTGHLAKIYGWSNLPSDRIIAANGEKGPQAEILAPGFHFILGLNVFYHVEMKPAVIVPEGKYGYLLAKDGQPLHEGQTYADPFDSEKLTEMLDAKMFLTKGGQKGPQTTILPPGTYRLNSYLWDVQMEEATEVPKGKVIVIKSNVWGGINFGNLVATKPDKAVIEVHDQDGPGKLAVPLVEVGCLGIWNQPLAPGMYYVNKKAYTTTPIETHLQTWDYKGGYTKRKIDLKIESDGKIIQEETKTVIPVPAEAADAAVNVKVEGWEVPLELRVLVQVVPEKAPFVVASVGGIQEIEDKVLTPTIRSIVRNVCGGMVTVPDPKNPGQTITRPAHVLDLIENREALETEVEQLIREEALKAGVDVREVRFGEPAIPPEFLVTRLREQLAQQMAKAYKEEELAQQERVMKEKASATADEQKNLVKAEIEVQRSQKLAEARKNEGQGEKDKLALIAEGQKLQAEVLGEDKVVELRKYEFMVDRLLKIVETDPSVLTVAIANAHKFVPERVFMVSGAGNGNGKGGHDSGVALMSAAGILGDFLGGGFKSSAPTPAVGPSMK